MNKDKDLVLVNHSPWNLSILDILWISEVSGSVLISGAHFELSKHFCTFGSVPNSAMPQFQGGGSTERGCMVVSPPVLNLHALKQLLMITTNKRKTLAALPLVEWRQPSQDS